MTAPASASEIRRCEIRALEDLCGGLLREGRPAGSGALYFCQLSGPPMAVWIMDVSAPQVFFGSSDGGLYLAFDGRATHRVCATADRLVGDYLAAHGESPRVVLDLTGCAWVDSTFAGWMLGLHRRVASSSGRGVYITGCSERCRASLDKMHLGVLFEYADVPPPEEVRSIACEGGDKPDKATLTLMAQAHQQLAALDADNQAVFGPIAEMLQRELRKAT